MAKNRHQKSRHQTLIDIAAPVYRALVHADIVPHLGYIDPFGKGPIRAILRVERTSKAIVITGKSTQTLWVYDAKVGIETIRTAIQNGGIQDITVRHGPQS